ncbi:MAG: cytochrome c [Pseudomonadota bacterium]
MGSYDAHPGARPLRLATVALASSVLLSLTLACTPPSNDATEAAAPTDESEATPEASAVQADADSTGASDSPTTPQEPVAAAVTDTAAEEGDGNAPPYDIACDADGNCLVDKATYVGWRTYHAACHVCHAQDAVGSTFAPSLVTRLQEIDKARFYESVTNGYTGQLGVMPAWGADPNVNTKFDELYAYLKARSDGILGAGRPTRKR